jgi:molybdopterin converting factor small subunit
MKPHVVSKGTTLSEVVQTIRKSLGDDPVAQSLIARTGEDHLTFVLNKRIVRGEMDLKIELKEGDDIRWMRPYAGG